MPGGESVRSTVARLVVGWITVLTVVFGIGVALPTPPSHAVITNMTCYTASDTDTDPADPDSDDRAITVDISKNDQDTAAAGDDTYTSSNETNLGNTLTGATAIEAVALRPGGSTLYTADGGVLGTIALSGGTVGTFTNIAGNTTGIGNSTDTVTYDGSTGTFTGGQTTNFNTINDIDGLTFDPFTQRLWGVVRIEENGVAPAEYDRLVIIDPATGLLVPQQFRNPGNISDLTDSVPVTPPAGGANDVSNLGDIDDIAIDPATGKLYGVANADGSGDQLVTIDKVTGRATIIGTLGITDVEGLGFSNVGGLFGEFFATTGELSVNVSERDRFWRVNTSSGSAIDEDSGTAGFQPLHDFTTANAADYESMDCLSSSVVNRQITGHVYVDVNQDGVYITGDGDTPYQNAAVRLYLDNNGDNLVDGGDSFVDNVSTNASGFYSFEVSFPSPTPAGAPRNFVLDVNTDTLPTGHAMTDGGAEEATFSGEPPTSSDTGQTNGVNNTDGSGNNVNNNFGFTSAPIISKTVVENETAVAAGLPASTLPQAGDILEYTITVNNTSTAANPIQYTDVDVTDATPSGTADLTCTWTFTDFSNGSSVSPATNCGASPNRVVDQTLDRGDVITITYRIQVNTPLTITAVNNTACRTINGSSQECDSTVTAIGATLGDIVYHDQDADGTQDVGEPGINGVDVTCNGPTTRTVTTANNGSVDGYYDCTRLAAGNYTADVDQADAVAAIAGVSLTTGNDPTATIALVAAQDYNDADFGFGSSVIDLELSKSVDNATPSVGDNVTFTLSLTNNTTNATANATGVTVTDALPTGLSYVSHTTAQGTYDSGTGVWTVGTVNDGATTSMTLTAKVDSEGTHVNKAQVTADNETDTDSTPANRTFPADDPVEDDEASASVSTPAAPPPAEPQYIDIELVKDASKTYLAVGEEFSYTIAVTNAEPGATSVAMNVRVIDHLPDGVTYIGHTASQGDYDPATGLWLIGSLRKGSTHHLVITARVDRPGQYVNVAYVSEASGDDRDSTPGAPHEPFQDDEDDARIEVGLIDLELTKEVSDGSVTVGEEFTFDLSVSNVEVPTSPATPATDVSVTDALPDGLRLVRVTSATGAFDDRTFIWFVGDLDVGESATLTLVVVADREGTFTNVAQVTAARGTDVDSTPGNDVPEEDDQDDAVVVVTIRGSIGDFVWLDRNGDGIQDDDELGLGGVVVALAGPMNSRPSSVGTIEAEETLQTDGEGRYLFEELTPGLYIVVIMEDTVPDGLANTLGTTWYEVNIGPGATYVDADFGYQPSSQELSIVKTVTPAGRVSMGDEPVYAITVSNNGWRTLEDVVVTDTAPDGTTYRPGTTTVGGKAVEDATGTGDPLPLAPQNGGIDLGDLDPGDSWTVTFGVTVDFQDPREIPNVAEVSSKQTGVTKSNEVIIQPGIDIDSGEALPATGGPVDRLLLLAGGALALGIVSLWSVRQPRGRRGPEANSERTPA